MKKKSTYSTDHQSFGKPEQKLNSEQEDQFISVSKHIAKPDVMRTPMSNELNEGTKSKITWNELMSKWNEIRKAGFVLVSNT